MKSITRLLFISIIFLFANQLAIGQTFKWARKAGSKSPIYEIGHEVVVDSQGNSYVTGQFSNSATFNSINLNSAGGTDIFIAKYDSSGTVLWAKRAGGASNEGGVAIALDGNGNLYITGTISAPASFNSTVISPSGFYNTFIAKYDTNGNFIWAINPQLTSHVDSPFGIAADSFGNVSVTGSFQSSISGPNGIYILMYNPSGGQNWQKLINSYGGTGREVDFDSVGNLYVTGSFGGSTNFGTSTLTPTTGESFIVKYTPNGNEIWATSIKSPNSNSGNHPYGIKVSLNGNVHVAGAFVNSIIFGSDTLTNNSIKSGMFTACYNSSGNYIWGRKAIGPELIIGRDVTVDLHGNTYVTGEFETSAQFGNLSLTGYPSTRLRPDIFVAKYDSVGNEIWAKKAGGSQDDYGLGVAVDNSGSVYLTGYFAEVAAFDPIIFPFDATDGYEIFLAKLGNAGPPPTTLSLNTIADSVFCVNANFSVPFSTTGIFSPGNTFTVQLSDPSGSFTMPINIGTGSTSPITVTIPPTIASGTGYKIRIVSSRPSIIGLTLPITLQITNLQGVNAGPDETVCIGSPLLLLTGAAPAGGNWSGKGVQQNTFDPAVAGIGTHILTYTVSSGNCFNSSTKKVNVVPLPVIQARIIPKGCSSSETTIGYAPFTPLFENTSLNSDSYLWEFGDGQTSTEKEPNHIYNLPGSYEVFLTADNGEDCVTRSKVAQITVKEPKAIPNVITPNGDKLNDTFKPEFTCQPLELKIFNRWGQQVYEEKNYQGTWGGENQVEGIYYYLLKSESNQSWKGWIEIIK